MVNCQIYQSSLNVIILQIQQDLSPCDVIICTLGHHLMVREKLSVARDLWAAGFRAEVLFDKTEVGCKYCCITISWGQKSMYDKTLVIEVLFDKTEIGWKNCINISLNASPFYPRFVTCIIKMLALIFTNHLI